MYFIMFVFSVYLYTWYYLYSIYTLAAHFETIPIKDIILVGKLFQQFSTFYVYVCKMIEKWVAVKRDRRNCLKLYQYVVVLVIIFHLMSFPIHFHPYSAHQYHVSSQQTMMMSMTVSHIKLCKIMSYKFKCDPI